jgi:acetolactate synthase-1/2/3 large subunit
MVNDVRIKMIIVRNGYLGLVREYQYNSYDAHYIGVRLNDWPKFDKIAEAYDIDYLYCSSDDELDDKLDEFLDGDRPCIMVCEIDSEDRVK